MFDYILVGYGKDLPYKYKSKRKDAFFKKGVIYNITIKHVWFVSIEIDVNGLPPSEINMFHHYHFFELFKPFGRELNPTSE